MKLLSLVITVLLLAPFSYIAEATPTLKSVMQGLGKSMEDLSQGIYEENFTVIGRAAAKVANHPKPKTQLPIVVGTLKERMPQFKAFDLKVHNSAAEIVELAKSKDMNGILKKHHVIMTNCVACHTQFRAEVSKALFNK